jgi:uncharacterized protein with NAD-binding domain and iron-sulfur cluster
MAKKKVVILGGGVSAVTVAIKLTDDPNWREQFESVTIYQLGWRLGGKGATGRASDANRILEHGLHIWLGYYENAFQLIQKVYANARRPPDSPIPTWEAAFTGQNYVGVEERGDGGWSPWLVYVQPNGAIPGGGDVLTLLDCLQQFMGWIKAKCDELKMRAEQLGSRLSAILVEFAPRLADETPAEDLIVTLCRLTETIWTNLAAEEKPSVELRRLLLLIEMGTTILNGLLAEGIQTYDDLEKLEGIDFSRWLSKYSAQPWIGDLTANPLLRGMYDFAFAYENGDVGRPNFAAAPALRTIFRMCLTFKGSIFYKMNAGMGDTIFAPAYEALRNRGVDIEFFHKVKRLELSADKSRVARIHMGRQATLKAAAYQPFVPVVVDEPPGRSPLPCWPGEPIYDQLVEGEALRQCKADLESFWSAWPDVEVTLEADKDFDVAVFGISLGSVPYLCQELVAASPAWANMVARVATVSTQSVQLWLKPAIAQLGWTEPSPILDAWIEPLDTWADMTNVMGSESWRGGRPGSLAYFCGPMVGGIPDQSDQGFPARAKAEVDAAADAMLRSDIQTLWPSVGAGGMLASDVVARHARANVDPSERYVQSLADSAQYRLPANGSGFANLVITGDWIWNGYNAGCVEAAVWAGMQAANTILGRPLNEGVITG